jgi:exopolysaccharide biosynthesis polyprenyl glycosylphosphotransferase
MNATGNPTALEHLKLRRRAQRSLILRSSLLSATDLIVGVALAHLFGLIFLPVDSGNWLTESFTSSFDREILFCIVILVLALRELQSADAVSFAARRGFTLALPARCIIVLAVVAAVEFAILRSGPLQLLRLLGCNGSFLVWFCLSRRIIITYCYHSEKNRPAREAANAVRPPNVTGQLAIRLAADAAVISILDEDLTELDGGPAASAEISELRELVRDGAVDAILLAVNRSDLSVAQPVVRQSDGLPLSVAGIVDATDPATAGRSIRAAVSVPGAMAVSGSLQHCDLRLKSIMDIVGAMVLLCLFSPVAIFVSLAIVLDSAGPVIYRQPRNGWGGRLFTIIKFRTMYQTADAVFRQTSRDDPRCTRVGSILRRTSLDELPQLWNVLRGDMSLVGPRPHADKFHIDAAGSRVVAEYALRHRVKPGLTGWAQIHGSRGAISTPEQMRIRIEYDLHYIDHWSIWLDIYILFLTPFAVLKGENAF